MNKKHVNIISIILFAIGISSALLILTDYLSHPLRPKLIEKDEALSIAAQAGKWNKDLLGDKTIDTKLLHIKNDGFAFSVDEKTLSDTTLVPNRFNDLKEDQYVWLVQIALVGGSNREWGYLIDASNGILLNPKQNITTLEPVDPQVSVKEGTLIRQASGNVTIVFPVGILKEESKQTPFPAELVVTQGDTVTWRNDDTQVHTVTSGFLQQPEFVGQVFDSGLIASGESFSHTFSDKRITSYHYFCGIHPWMTGEVLVQHPESITRSFTYQIDSFVVSTTITNGSINNITKLDDSNSILIELSPFNQGNLIIKIPKTLLKALDNDYSKFSFFVISDGEETNYEQIDSETIKINFQNNTKKIEIIGASRLN